VLNSLNDQAVSLPAIVRECNLLTHRLFEGRYSIEYSFLSGFQLPFTLPACMGVANGETVRQYAPAIGFPTHSIVGLQLQKRGVFDDLRDDQTCYAAAGLSQSPQQHFMKCMACMPWTGSLSPRLPLLLLLLPRPSLSPYRNSPSKWLL
jgi:hypothetical protein